MKPSSMNSLIHNVQKIKAQMRQLIDDLREDAWRTEPMASRPKEGTTNAARR